MDFNLRSPDLSVPGRPLQHVLLRPAARYRDLSRARGQSDVLPPTESPPPDIPLKNFLQLPRDLERGEEAMRKGKWEDAAAKYSRLIQLYPHLLESYLQLGLAWWKKGERSTAWSSWKKALAVDPQDLTAYLLLAASLAEAGESDQAEHYLNQVRELQPETVLDPSSLMICLTPDADALRKVCWERYQSELNKDQDSVPVLEQKLTGTSSPLLRIALAGALSRLGSPMGKPVLDRMSKSPYRHVRAQALEELAKVSDAARSARVRLSPEQELSASAAVIARQSVPLRDQPLPFPTRMARLLKILSQAPDVSEEDRLFVVETLVRRWNYPVNVRRTMWLSAAFTYLVINPGN